MGLSRKLGIGLLAAAMSATALASPKITYQGRLTDGGAPVNGMGDFRVGVFTTETGGSPYDTTTLLTVPIVDGLFQLDVDVDPGAFNGNDAWFEIQAAFPSGGSLVTLTPRQKVGVAPYASFALDSANGSQWSNVSSGIAYNAGSVGIGTALPNAKLHVSGSDGGGMTANFNDELFVNDLTSFVGVGRSARVSANEAFGVYRPGAGFGGMYIKTDSTGSPFYGYSVGGDISAYHYFNNGDGSWRLYLGGDRLTVQNDGDLGVGTTSPSARVHAYTNGITALRGENSNGNYAYLGNNTYAAYARHNNGNYAQIATAAYGVRARHSSSNNLGYLASTTYGAFGRHDASNHYGYLGNDTYGVGGSSDDAFGALGGTSGVYGSHTSSGNFGILGSSSAGAGGTSGTGTAVGLLGYGNTGVYGLTTHATSPAGYFINLGTGPALVADGLARVDVLEIVGGSDLAEPFDIRSDREIEPGMVVSIDPDNVGKLIVSSKAYDRTVAGVISGAGGVNPGMVMRQSDSVADGKHPVALTGRVQVMCDATSGAIEPGDLLTTSDTPGHAMKVSDHARAQGAIIGKAMSSLDEGETGLVLVLVNLQ